MTGPNNEVPPHHILDTDPLGAIRVALCGQEMPPNDIRLGMTTQVCQACIRARQQRRQAGPR